MKQSDNKPKPSSKADEPEIIESEMPEAEEKTMLASSPPPGATIMEKSMRGNAPVAEMIKEEILASRQKTLSLSYMELRTAIGALAFAIPFAVSLVALIFFKEGLQPSISAYYYTGSRDILVGALFAAGFFLFSYRYERADNIAAKLAFVFTLGIALFPTTPPAGSGIAVTETAKTLGSIHLVLGAAFFLTLSYFCLFLFVKTDATPKHPMTQQKVYRNRVYRTCGVIMLVCIVLIAVYYLTGGDGSNSMASLHPTYWLETVALLAFGVSWLTKGQAILKDQA